MIQQATDTTDFTAMREAMVASQLRTNAVDDPRIVAAMLRVPREAYLPESVARLAYRDTAVPLGRNRAANVPVATGRLLTAADIAPTDSVLLIGAAGGYTAAVLAELAATVTAVESDPDLAGAARVALGDARVTLVEGPLEAGAPAGAPYDVLVVDGAVEHLPDTLVAQVRPGGTVVAGLIDRGVTRLAAGVRTEGGFGLRAFADMDCVALPGFAKPKSFRF
ncbi:protein-L-isoaspartate(D-aspartate) O-methyltransferase [Hephaestia caeni]|uniref:Protein-L-isoaspartate O-methyltransferase n=1 Tax=Hephaestia caeni TaxID=645617 RepID=A0A397PCM7_9SPHN|nr:protein-L-isoaspartate O-methyltransferase [Hephaestia caeni]RIA46792.1 protein-L-isoaspartate(D-aspartate) O-methyltransferase [Hephaestia caeni]